MGSAMGQVTYALCEHTGQDGKGLLSDERERTLAIAVAITLLGICARTVAIHDVLMRDLQAKGGTGQGCQRQRRDAGAVGSASARHATPQHVGCTPNAHVPTHAQTRTHASGPSYAAGTSPFPQPPPPNRSFPSLRRARGTLSSPSTSLARIQNGQWS